VTAKQLTGLYSPDKSRYGCLADGNNNLVTPPSVSSGGSKQLSGLHSPDGSLYVTLTDGAGNLAGTVPSGNSPQVQQFFNRLATLPSSSDQTAYATFINALVPDNTWTALDALVVAAAPDSGTSLTELTSGIVTPTLDISTGVPTFTAYRGWTKFLQTGLSDINSNFNPSTAGGNYKQNAATIACWNLSTTQVNSTLWQDLTDTNIECWPLYSNGNTYTQINDASEVFVIAGLDSSGWFSVNRTASNSYTVKRNNVLLATQTTVSVALENSNIYFGQNSSSNVQIIAGYAIGALSSSQETTLFNALHTLLHTFGAV
jgi:hypothetical protein